jgi:hypothetical protein
VDEGVQPSRTEGLRRDRQQEGDPTHRNAFSSQVRRPHSHLWTFFVSVFSGTSTCVVAHQLSKARCNE